MRKRTILIAGLILLLTAACEQGTGESQVNDCPPYSMLCPPASIETGGAGPT